MGVSEWMEDDYSYTLSLTKAKPYRCLCGAQAAHHDFELNKLNNVHDAVWAGFMQPMRSANWASFAKPGIVKWLEEPAPEGAV